MSQSKYCCCKNNSNVVIYMTRVTELDGIHYFDGSFILRKFAQNRQQKCDTNFMLGK